MPILSAIDSATPAFERVTAMLFRPFRVKNWIKIGFIGWLAGGIASSSGNFNFRTPSFRTGGADAPWRKIPEAIRSIHLGDYIWIIATMAAIFLAISLVFVYLFCRFRFILFDSVISGDAAIGRGWRRYRPQAGRYFGFWLIYTLLTWVLFGAVAGIPLWRAYKSGVFNSSSSLSAIFAVLSSIVLGILALAILGAIVSSLAKDFIVPLMALDDLRVGQACSTLKMWITSEPGAWAGYLGMKVVFAIGSTIAFSIVLVVVVLVLAVPVLVLAIVGIALFKAAGAGGVAIGIAFAVILGVALMVFGMMLALSLSAPIVVFFQSYSLYFMGGRYPKLGALLWPVPPAV